MSEQDKRIDWIDVNARVNIAGALLLIAIALLLIAYKLA